MISMGMKSRVSIKSTGNIWFCGICMVQCFKGYDFVRLLYTESSNDITVFPHELRDPWETEGVYELKRFKNGNGAIINAGRFINDLHNLELVYGQYSPLWREEYKTLKINLNERTVKYEKQKMCSLYQS